MDEISARLEISKKTIYTEFTSKEDLVERTIDFLFQKHFMFFEGIEHQKMPIKKKIEKIYEYGINELVQFREIFFYDLKKYYSRAYLKYKNHRRRLIFNKIKNILEDAQLDGEIDEEIDINLFCELNLLNLDRLFAESELARHYSSELLMRHSVGVSLKGILNCKS